MTLPADIKPQAAAQLYAAAAWYKEQEPDQDLWLELLDEVDGVLGLICDNPQMFIEWDGPIRRAVLRKFPYALYYLAERERIVVLRFLAMSQERQPAP